MDRIRLDKYLFLIRCYVGVGFEVFLKEGEKGGEKKKKGKGKGKRKREDEAENKNGVEGTEGNEGLDTYLSMMEEGPLSPLIFELVAGEKSTSMTKGPDGLRYHILDIWLDELEKVCAEPVEKDPSSGNGEGEDEEPEQKTKLKDGVPMELILRPIRRLRKESPNKIVRRRAAAVLDDDRLVDWGVVVREQDSEDDDEEWGGIIE